LSLSEGAELMFSPGENTLFPAEAEGRAGLPGLGAAGGAGDREVLGRRRRAPVWLCHPRVGAGGEPGWLSHPEPVGWDLPGTFPGVAAAPDAGPEHPTGAGAGTNTAGRGTSAVGRMGPVMVLAAPRVGGGGLKIGDELACGARAVTPHPGRFQSSGTGAGKL